MGVGVGLYMYDVVVKAFTFVISSTLKFLSKFILKFVHKLTLYLSLYRQTYHSSVFDYLATSAPPLPVVVYLLEL